MRALHPLAPASRLAPAGSDCTPQPGWDLSPRRPAVPPAGGLRAVPQAAPAVPPSGGREPDTAGMAAHRGLARGPHEPQRPGHLARLSPVRAPRYRQPLRGRRDDRPAGTRPSGRTPERRDGGPTSHRARDAHPRHADCGSRMRSTPGAALPVDLRAPRHTADRLPPRTIRLPKRRSTRATTVPTAPRGSAASKTPAPTARASSPGTTPSTATRASGC